MINIGKVVGLIELNDRFTTRLAKAGAELAGFDSRTSRLIKTIDAVESKLTALHNTIDKTGDRLQDVGTKLTMRVTLPLAASGGVAIKAAMDYETAFAGVRKTVNGTVDVMGNLTARGAELRQGIRDMARDLPITAVELAGVAEAAGQLGIKAENILSFSRTMVDMGVSTNMSAETSAVALSKLANITRMPQTEFQRLGSTVVALGTDTEATESEIVEFALRIAAAGDIAGINRAEVLGFGAALTSVGVQAEAGGTAVSKIFTKIFEAVKTGGSELQSFAETANMSAADFVTAFESDPSNAVISFIEGLDRINKSGGNVFAVLRDVEFQDERLKRAILSTAGAGDKLRHAVELANVSWRENTALTREAEQRYRTTASLLQVLWNRATDIAITVGNAMNPAFRTLISLLNMLLVPLRFAADVFSKLPGPIQLLALGMVLAAAAAGPLLFVLGSLVKTLLLMSTLASINTALNLMTGSAIVQTGVFARLTATLGPWLTRIGAATGLSQGLGAALGVMGGWLTRLGTWVLALIRPLLSFNVLLTALRGVVGGTIGLVSKLVLAFAALVGWPITIATGLALLLVSFPRVRQVIADVASIISTLIGWLMDLAGILVDRIVRNVKAAIDQLKAMWHWVVENIPGFKAIAEGADAAANGLHNMAVSMKEYRAASKVDNMPDLPAAPKLANQVFTPRVLSLDQGLALSHGYTGDLADKASVSLHLLTTRLTTAEDAMRKLSDTQTNYLTKAIAEGVLNNEEMADAAGTNVGVVEQFIRRQREAAQAVEQSNSFLKENQDRLKQLTKTLRLANEHHVDAKTQIELWGKEAIEGTRLAQAFGQTVSTEIKTLAELTVWSEARERMAELAQETRDFDKTMRDLADTGQQFDTMFVDPFGKSLLKMSALVAKPKKDLDDMTSSESLTAFFDMATVVEGPNAGDLKATVTSTFLDAFKGIPSLLVQSFTGGGGVSGMVSALSTQLTSGLFGGEGDNAGPFAGLTKRLGGWVTGATGFMGKGVSTVLGGIASAALPALGSMIVPAITAIVGLFKKPEWKKVMKDVGRDWGVEISEELAKKIAKDTEKMGRQFGTLLHLDEIIKEGGGVEKFGIDKTIDRLNDLFVGVSQGALTSQQAVETLGKTFPDLSAAVLKTGKIASTQFHELIQKAAQLKGGVKEVTDFLKSQGARFGEAAVKGMGPLVAEFEKLKELSEKGDTIRFNAPGGDAEKKIFGNTDRLSRQAREELNQLDKAWGAQRDKVIALQPEIERFGRLTLAAFNGARASGLTTGEAIAAIGPSLDTLIPMYERLTSLGITTNNAAVTELLAKRELYTANVALVESAGALNEMALSLSFLNGLNAETLADLGAQGASTFDQLIAKGFTEADALQEISGFLSTARDGYAKLGIPIDANTAKLIALAEANGVLGAETIDTNSILMEGFGALITALGGTLPESFRKFAEAGQRAAGEVAGAIDRIPTSIRIDAEVDVDIPDFDRRPYAGPDVSGVPEFAKGGKVLPFIKKAQHLADGGYAGTLVHFQPKGRDVSPAMLTPGEIVLNAAMQENVAAQLQTNVRGMRAFEESRLQATGTDGQPVVIYEDNRQYHLSAIDSQSLEDACTRGGGIHDILIEDADFDKRGRGERWAGVIERKRKRSRK